MTAPPAPSDPPAPGKPQFGLATATFVVIASMVGSGVLTTSGFTVYYVGSNQLMLALWIVGGMIAVCGALCIAELCAAMPRSGGDYVFLLEAYGPCVAFLSGWVSFLIGFGGPIAVTASASAQYLIEPLVSSEQGGAIARLVLATLAILAFALIHSLGHSPSARAQGITTVFKLAVLVGLALLGLCAGWGRWQQLDDRPALDTGRWTAMFFSLIYISYAYTGWNGAGYIAGEVDRPQRLVPRAILLGTGLVVVLYLALNSFYALALSADDITRLVNSSDPPNPSLVAPIARLAFERLLGTGWSRLLSVAVGLTLLASLSAYVLTGPRVAHAMAGAGQFPKVAGRISSKTGAPVIATWLQVAWALLLLWTGSFESLLEYSSVGLALFSMLTISSVFMLRWKRPDLPRPFRVPGYPFVPGLYLILTGLLTAAAFQRKPLESSLALASIALGLPVYWLWKRAERNQPERPRK